MASQITFAKYSLSGTAYGTYTSFAKLNVPLSGFLKKEDLSYLDKDINMNVNQDISKVDKLDTRFELKFWIAESYNGNTPVEIQFYPRTYPRELKFVSTTNGCDLTMVPNIYSERSFLVQLNIKYPKSLNPYAPGLSKEAKQERILNIKTCIKTTLKEAATDGMIKLPVRLTLQDNSAGFQL